MRHFWKVMYIYRRDFSASLGCFYNAFEHKKMSKNSSCFVCTVWFFVCLGFGFFKGWGAWRGEGSWKDCAMSGNCSFAL